jgi:cytochrome c553
MIKKIVFTTALMLASAAAMANDTDIVKPNLANGKQLSERCLACHNESRLEEFNYFPYLEGQKYKYIVRQLNNFKLGLRKSPFMEGEVAYLTGQDMIDVAYYFSLQDKKNHK